MQNENKCKQGTELKRKKKKTFADTENGYFIESIERLEYWRIHWILKLFQLFAYAVCSDHINSCSVYWYCVHWTCIYLVYNYKLYSLIDARHYFLHQFSRLFFFPPEMRSPHRTLDSFHIFWTECVEYVYTFTLFIFFPNSFAHQLILLLFVGLRCNGRINFQAKTWKLLNFVIFRFPLQYSWTFLPSIPKKKKKKT